jgi:hypothetical protein
MIMFNTRPRTPDCLEKELSPGHAVIMFNADSPNIRRGETKVGGGATLTRKKTVNDHQPEEGR